MAIIHKVTRFDFAPDSALTAFIADQLSTGSRSIQDIMDAGTQAGFDPRAMATEVGILLMDKALKPVTPTVRLSGSTLVELADADRLASRSRQSPPHTG